MEEPMGNEAGEYNLAVIRELLLVAFTPKTLRRFCQDRPAFRPIVDRFGEGHGLDDMVDEVVDYCETRLLWAELLAAVKEENSRQYARFEAVLRKPVPVDRAPVDPAAVTAYLEVVCNQCEHAETRPFRQLSELRGAPQRLYLLDKEDRAGVYVPLRFDVHFQRDHPQFRRVVDAFFEAADHSQDVSDSAAPADVVLPAEMSLSDARLRGVLDVTSRDMVGHVVFIGAAGCGKTTILRLVATVLASQDSTLAHDVLGLEPDPEASPLPIFVALREFEHACQTYPDTYRRDVAGLLRFTDDHFESWHPDLVHKGFVSGLVRSGRAWLLLDALDEVADFDHRIAMRQVIEGLADAFPGNRLLVTARVAAYASANTRLDERFHVATVRDLTREQWAPLVERLYAGMEADPDVASKRARLLLERIDQARMLREMVKTPLMVWTATLIHYANRELPEQRAELYGAYVDVLLGERLREEESAEPAQRLRDERWPYEDRRLYLTYAAYRVHEAAQRERTDSDRDVPVVVDERDLVTDILAPFMKDYLGLEAHQARREAADFLALMAERSGLLHAHLEGYSFGDHLTIQEFLAANYLVDNVRGTESWNEFLEAHAEQSWWREVFLLMAGYLLQWPQQARRYLLSELGNLPGDSDPHVYALAWAGRALLDISPQRVGWHANVRDELARRLVRMISQNPPTCSVEARVEAGDVLGCLGDLRFSDDLSLPEFVSVPAGRFWMGSHDAEVERLKQQTGRDWFNQELPRHQIDLDAFAIARYPTTNAMFHCFVEDGGYTDEIWWYEAKVAGVWGVESGSSDPRDWVTLGREQPAYWDDTRFNAANQPVVGITWYESAAYCRWLTATLSDGYEYRLPTEAEWERSARGPNAYQYPWGNKWEEGKANTAELNLGRTTPVGIFTDGASVEGLLDLCGNVWEWCSDWYSEGTYRSRANRVEVNPLGPWRGPRRGPWKGWSRILRGGSWYEGHARARGAYRASNRPGLKNYNFGFRIVRTLLR